MSYRVGIIGLGFIADKHASAYADTERLDCSAVADIDAERRREFGDAWGVPDERRYCDYESMLHSEDLDVVAVCTPTTLHEDQTVDAARSEADPDVIFVEKPISTSVRAAENMVESCEETDTELLVNHTRRFIPEVQRLRSLIDRDEIVGDITAINTQWKEELLRNGTHQVDLLVFFTGSRGATVHGGHVLDRGSVSPDAVGAVDDDQFDDAGAMGLVQLRDGTIATIDCSQPRDRLRTITDITGTDGRLHVHWNVDELRYWSFVDGDESEEELPELADPDLSALDRSLDHAASHLVDLIEDNAENISPGVDARHVLEILIGIYIAHSTDGAVSLPLDDPLKHVTVSSY